MTELIRKSDAIRVMLAYASSYSAEEAETAIRSLPAVTVSVVSQPVRYCPICDIADCATHRPEPAPDPAAIWEALEACRIIDEAVKEGHESVSELVLHLLSAAEPARTALALIAKGAAE